MSTKEVITQEEAISLKKENARLLERMSGMIPAVPSNNYRARIGSQVVPVFMPHVRAEFTGDEQVIGVILEEIGTGLPAVASLFKEGPISTMNGDQLVTSLDFAYVLKPNLDETVAKIEEGHRVYPAKKVA